MTRKIRSSLRHLRRSIAPPFWPISRKEHAWTVKPSPGPHPLFKSIPLGIVVRDILGYATSMREARRILNERKISIDGRVITDYKFPVGLMDIIHVIPEGKFYRVVPDAIKKLKLVEIPQEEAGYKLLKVIRKQSVRGGSIQLTLHDGRNILLPKPGEGGLNVRTFDSLLITIPKQSIVQHVPLREGVLAAVTDGRHVGFVGRIESIQQVFKRKDALVVLKNDQGETARTKLEYILPVGTEKPLVTIG
ncbi:30S ribosomal protein S4e [Infirmifilum lucidum]|uniref:Small ribosomal subunit protein eS4 n=1 Tax=Infirmifilum lucidum TaxID=2776706 RepID=A0A7L9FGD9_9CREN|nr:30S ribosomal protein S4e [Infirmifilum lucidum]QOJ78382.1 30S ribosomal protein S4e [Infirmifilum lucidum]